MNELHNYLKKKAELESITASMRDCDSDLAELNRISAETKASITAMNGKLANGNKNIARGLMTSEQYMGIKQQIEKEEVALANLTETITVQKSAKEILVSDLARTRAVFFEIRKRMAAELSDQAVNDIAGVVGEPLKNLAYTLLAGKGVAEKQDDVYELIGVKLCKAIFGEQHEFKAKLPSVLEARKKADEMIEALQ